MWVKAESQVVIEGINLTAVKDCSVFVEGESIPCEKLPAPSKSVFSIPVQQTITPVQEPGHTPISPMIYVIFSAVVFVLGLLLVVFTCIVSVAVLRKKAYSRNLRYNYNV